MNKISGRELALHTSNIMITHRSVKARLGKIQHVIVKTMGVVLVGFGARIAFLHQGGS